MKTYIVDIDGTLCTQTDGQYAEAKPLREPIDRVNALFDAGERIILWTARGTTTGICWRELTERQMREWGVKYHELWMKKPHYDVFVCDKSQNWAA